MITIYVSGVDAMEYDVICDTGCDGTERNTNWGVMGYWIRTGCGMRDETTGGTPYRTVRGKHYITCHTQNKVVHHYAH